MQKTVSDSIVQQLQKNEKVKRAAAFFRANAERFTREQLELCQIPAPPFGEAHRAEYFRQMFVKTGYKNARLDREGNVLALREGTDLRPLLIVSAHLDTVFPAETDLTPRFENNKIFAPGVMDDGCGLIAVMAIAEALNQAQIKTTGSILFVGTVGEEGAGNLRGVRHLFTNGEFASQISAFISLDGAGVAQIVNRALGSRRYAVKLNGVGGHSWLDFGAPNPVHALGRAIAKLAAFQVSATEKTTFNVGTIAGGTSVNAIPSEAGMEVDLRSESEPELHRLDAFFRRAVFEAVDEENDARNAKYKVLDFDLQITGERPGGATAEDAPLVRLALAATEAVGVKPQLTISSTDSNVPMSLDFPAVTLGAGGAGDKMHTLGEWYDPTGREIGLQRALLMILAYVGLTQNDNR